MERAFLIAGLIISILLFFALIMTFFINIFLPPTVMTPGYIIEEIIEKMKLKKGQKVVDLGSGNGDFLISVCYSQKVEAIGYEVSPIHVYISKIAKLLRLGLSKYPVFEVENLLQAKLKDVDIVYCHLNKSFMRLVYKKLGNKFPKKALLYSYQYPVPDLNPEETFKLSNGKELFIYTAENLK